eukprot:CAMPEP_0203819944 /NCGR_PEP_ID=MMETSP0115-20131106/38052_1 /ASSEMBLY_ACC=CAM_ASM_000227 /TAXON_ID=33651 /ORGANISM="Bicosoecid sp, Strain ms1" /LENGTH=95 /DNA_ID=CAMNT_0050728939 /DNA_START=186 /DNA_END=469 /DNA_ORIENTATION=+
MDVSWRANLGWIPFSDAVAAGVVGVGSAGGVDRAEAFEGADRVLLPASAAAALANSPNARSPYTFELRAGGNIAYCGVREFTAPEGMVVLPQKVV